MQLLQKIFLSENYQHTAFKRRDAKATADVFYREVIYRKRSRKYCCHFKRYFKEN